MKKLALLLLALLALGYQNSFATHIRSGRIDYEKIDGTTYRIILTGYADKGSSVLFGSNGTLDFGDGDFIQINNDGETSSPPRTSLNDDTWKYTLVEEHTFPAAGKYTISFREYYRNEGVLNMNNSVNMPFYIESTIVVDNQLQNSSPRLQEVPDFFHHTGRTYHYHPMMQDAEGDSLSYHLSPSLQDENTLCSNYRFPNLTFPAGDARNGSSESGEASYFRINSATGDIIWDAPGTKGEYNFAFVVKEWRKIEGKMVQIGSVMQDMQLVVRIPTENLLTIDFPFEKQEIQLEKDVLVEATITARAENAADPVVLYLAGDFLAVGTITPEDSVVGTGEVSITIQYLPQQLENAKRQLIATAFIPQADKYSQPTRSRSVYLVSPPPPTPPVTAVDKELAGREIIVYPNPSASGSLYLKAEALKGSTVKIKLISGSGKLVHQQTSSLMDKEVLIKPTQKLKGLYLLHIESNGQSLYKRVLFQ